MTPTTSTDSEDPVRTTQVYVFANSDRMPLLGLGTWKSEPGEVYAAVREAIRIGYRHIDCASFYGNEAEIGNAIRDAVRDGVVSRQDLFIVSKLWGNCHGRTNVEPTLTRGWVRVGEECGRLERSTSPSSPSSQ